jgi:hypothetical protein
MEHKHKLTIAILSLIVLAAAFITVSLLVQRVADEQESIDESDELIIDEEKAVTPGADLPDEKEAKSNEAAVLSVAFMVHMEGWSNEAEDINAYESHIGAIQELRTLFDRYDAKLTLEASPELIEADAKWGQYWIAKWDEAGHGIGVHADVGGSLRETQTSMTLEMRVMRENLEKLLGHQVLHVSGVCSANDWVEATIDAGFEFVTGIVGYCAMAMPAESRPAEFRFCANPGECHDPMPTTIAEKLHPWSTSDVSTWTTPDVNGELTLLPGTEIIKGLDGDSSAFMPPDVDAYEVLLKEAISLAEPGEVNLFYTGVSVGNAGINEDLYNDFLSRTQSYVDQGLVEWKTLPEVYLEYKTN